MARPTSGEVGPPPRLGAPAGGLRFADPRFGRGTKTRFAVRAPVHEATANPQDQTRRAWRGWAWLLGVGLLGRTVAAAGGDLAAPSSPERQTVNVLVICFDPVLTSRGHVKLHEHYKWSDPWHLTDKMVEDARVCSGGYVDYRVVEKIDYNGFTQFRNGYTYTEDAFLEMWEKHRDQANPGMTSFRWLFEKFGIEARIRAKDLREIWLWGAPYMQWDELHWKTPGDRVPYPTDNPWFYRPYDIPDVGRTIWIMGWNYERGEGEMLESYGHRIESVLSLTVGRGIWDPKRQPDNVWNRFTRVDKDFPGESEVGSVHYAPNSTSDYDWSNPNPVWTYADDWLTYPRLPRNKKLLNATTGQWDGILAHHLWWMKRLPRAAGVTDGFYNNWWQYIVNYDAALRKLPPPGATFQKPSQAMYAD